MTYRLIATFPPSVRVARFSAAMLSALLLTASASAEAEPEAATGTQQRSGEIDVRVNVPAAIDVDGKHAGDAPLQKPLKVAPGEHVVSVSAPGYAPARQSVTVPGQGGAGLTFELEPSEAKPAHVTVYSPLRDVEVLVDDVLVGKTPLPEPLLVAPGKHVFELQRPGYMSLRKTVDLGDGVYSTVAFDPDEDPSNEAPRGRLALTGASGKLGVTIDGRWRGYYRGTIALPPGAHLVHVEKTGYEPFEQTVDVREGSETTVEASLRPDATARAAVAASARRYRNWGIAALVGGGLMAGGFTGLAVWSSGKLSPAEDKLATVQKDPGQGGGCVTDVQKLACDQRVADAQSDVNTYRSARLYGFIGIGVGAALIATGITLLVIAPRAQPAEEAKASELSSLEPEFFAGPGAAGLRLRGRF